MAPIEQPAKDTPPQAEDKPPERTPQTTRKLAAAVTKTKPTRRLRPGDLICGQCGEGNPPVRKFCSRCGSSLLEAEHVRQPWWRRLVPKGRHGPRSVDVSDPADAAGARGSSVAHDAHVRKALAGHDPKHALRKVYRRARLVLALVIVVGIFAYGAIAPFRNMIDSQVDSAKNKISKSVDIHYDPVHAVAVSANLQKRGYPGSNAVDSFLNTYWLARYSASDYPTLTLTFAKPVTLERMIIYSGGSANFQAHGRPSLLVLVFSNNKSDTLTPQDTPKEQTLDISNAVRVKSVKIEVEGIYPGRTHHPDVAISDIELFKLQ